MIDGIWNPLEQSLVDGAVNQLDRAVVLEHHARRDIRNRGLQLIRHAAYAQQELVLLRACSGLLSGSIAEIKKAPELKAEFSEALEVLPVQVFSGVQRG